jgi:hypothetical protein
MIHDTLIFSHRGFTDFGIIEFGPASFCAIRSNTEAEIDYETCLKSREIHVERESSRSNVFLPLHGRIIRVTTLNT